MGNRKKSIWVVQEEIQSVFHYNFIHSIFHYKGSEQYYVVTMTLGMLST